MRVYIPATIGILTAAVEAQVVRPTGGHAFGVTPELRAAYGPADDEELEYLAMVDAARASLRLLGAEPDAPRLRVVIAADTGAAEPNPDGDRSSVRVSGEIGWRDVAAVHLDGADAADAVAAAVAAVHEADLGDPDAEFVLGTAEDFELAWYAPDEVSYLIAELGS